RSVASDGAFPFEDVVAALADAAAFSTTVIYRPRPVGEGYSSEFFFRRNLTDRQLRLFSGTLGARKRFLGYDPLRPASFQRNRGPNVGRSVGHTPIAVATWRAIGLDTENFEQTRVLVCDGELLLAWVGGFHERVLDAAELRAFRGLTRPLKT